MKKNSMWISNEKLHLRNSSHKNIQLLETKKAISIANKIKRYIKSLEKKEENSMNKVKQLLQKKKESVPNFI